MTTPTTTRASVLPNDALIAQMRNGVRTATGKVGLLHKFVTIGCSDCGTQQTVPMKCSDRFCFVCAGPEIVRKQAKVIHRTKKLDHEIFTLRMLTLTVKNDSNLERMMNHLFASFERLRRTPWWQYAVLGGVYTIEITFGRDRKWHAHIHSIVHSRYMHPSQLRHWWSKACRQMKTGAMCNVKWPITEKALHYLCDYITKADFPEEYRPYVKAITKGRRMLNFFGTWRCQPMTKKRERCPCKACGSLALGRVGNYDYQIVPDYRSLSPPLLRADFPVVGDQTFACIEKTFNDLWFSSMKRKKATLKTFTEAKNTHVIGEKKFIKLKIDKTPPILYPGMVLDKRIL